jgi:hypothetical protein
MKTIQTINSDDFEVIFDRKLHGSPVGRGWSAYRGQTCEQCGCDWEHVARPGTKGWICPRCGHYMGQYKWLGQKNEPPCDGCWVDPVGWEPLDCSLN